ncbi:MAG TPA: hypothetical protein VFB30_17855, partial [Spirochaetia bacterium]|nr:hypothetical protein [Spirochaetia bacterium]
MNQIYIAGLIFLSGFLTYSAVSHLTNGRRGLQFRVHALLAGICLVMAALIPSEIMVLRAGNLADYLAASRFNVAGLILISSLLPWFFAEYADVHPKPVLFGSSFLHAAVFLANLIQP